MSDRTVPSPPLDSMIEGVKDPNALAHKIVRQEGELAHRGVDRSRDYGLLGPLPDNIGDGDLLAEIKKHRS